MKDIGGLVKGEVVGARVEEHRGFAVRFETADPQRRLRDGHGEVVDFDPVELIETDALPLGLLVLKSHARLTLPQLAQNRVFELAQADIRLREEIAAPAGGVEKL